MLRICVASVIYRATLPHSKAFLGLLRSGEPAGRDSKGALGELMRLAENLIVMERWMGRFEYV